MDFAAHGCRGRSSLGRALARLALLALLLGSSSGVMAEEGGGAPWWNDDWAYRKEITLDAGPTGASLTETLVDLPVVLGLSIANFAYFSETQPTGADLRFVAADGVTPLDFHIEMYDAATMLALVWVQVPAISAGTASHIYMYYGNAEAVPAGNSTSTYDANQVLVYHFDQGASSTDATAYGNQPLIEAGEDTAARFGAGLALDGNSRVTVPASASLALSAEQGFTVTAWVRADEAQADASVVTLQAVDGTTLSVDLANLTPTIRLAAPGAAPSGAIAETLALTPGLWSQLALEGDGAGARLYLDGELAATLEVPLPTFGGDITFGAAPDATRGLIGGLDEVTVARAARGAAWLRAMADSQSIAPTLVRYGPSSSSRDAEGGGEPNYFLITLDNVTPDGWVVIIILAVMAVISWLVMAWKAIVIGRTKSQNNAFLKHFYSLGSGGDPARLDEEEEAAAKREGHGHFESSVLYQMYHVGIAETKGRVKGAAVGADRAMRLGPESVAAIRASLDAKVVREYQRINSLMVLLTLAIAGGPFLGLLGTVVGVMITFAAIAHEGNVDVNAIAPGIAAALAATVAGLAVAIPALFAYNYLSSQIKEINADMRVFLDEFITRIGEYYS